MGVPFASAPTLLESPLYWRRWVNVVFLHCDPETLTGSNLQSSSAVHSWPLPDTYITTDSKRLAVTTGGSVGGGSVGGPTWISPSSKYCGPYHGWFGSALSR